MNVNRLPTPDPWGNYWFGKPGSSTAPAILPILSDPKLKGSYFLQLGDQGCVFEGGKFKVYPTAEAALAELQIRLKLRGIHPGKK